MGKHPLWVVFGEIILWVSRQKKNTGNTRVQTSIGLAQCTPQDAYVGLIRVDPSVGCPYLNLKGAHG